MPLRSPGSLGSRTQCASSSTNRARSSPRPESRSPSIGFAKTADEARRIAEEIAGPVVIKSQVLTGGRMKAGGVQFADTPDEAARHAEHILDLEIGGHMPRGVLVDSRAAVKHEYYAGVVWDGIRKRPVMLFSDMGGIDIEEVAEQHPDHVARGHFSTLQPVLGLAGQAGDRLARRHRLGAQPPDADPGAAGPAVPRVRHDAGRDQSARRARGRLVRRPRRAHGHGERGPAAPEGAAARSSASATRRRARRASRRRSSSPARRSTPRTTAASPAT